MSLEERFNEAAEKIKGVPASKTSNEEKLVSVRRLRDSCFYFSPMITVLDEVRVACDGGNDNG